MCGIAGFFSADREPVSAKVLKDMCDSIAHRGPDGEGQYQDEHIGLGHRRLAIIDLSPAGAQPMMNSAQQQIITYNGEMYNFKELKIELEAAGQQFLTKTDTEVVLKAYAEWGPDCIKKFNGMFAFAIWDKKERTLFAARDRYGIKPLYYFQKGNTLLFSSEIKAFYHHPAFKAELNKQAMIEYFTFQNIFTDQTLFDNVHLLPPGCSFTIGQDKKFKVHRYWDYHFETPTEKIDDREYEEELDRLFVQAVNRQLVGDVEISSYLSGGMDSGSITAIAAKQLPFMRSFTVGFDLNSSSGLELNFDERAQAEHMSYLFKTEHYEVVLKSGDMERCLPPLTRHLEDLRVGQSYPNFYASKLAGKFNKVVLSGAGGDELFGGYPWRYYRAVVNDKFDDYIDKYYHLWQRLIPNNEIHKIFSPVASDVKNVWTRDIFKSVFNTHKNELRTPEDYVNHSLYFEAKTFLHGLLVVDDKYSMAHGLEARVPFLDNDLVDFSMKIPAHLKLGNLQKIIDINENEPGHKTQKYFNKTQDGKLLLRKVMERHIPREVTQRIKQGFSAPDASWFKGDSLDFVRRKICSKDARIYSIMDYNETQTLINQHLDGTQNRRLLIWSLLNFEQWMEEFL